jgi:hypothetical protein
VTGVGQGADPEAAAEAARAEVASKARGETEGVEIVRRYVAKKPKVHWALAVLDRPALIARLAERIAEDEQQIAAAAESARNTAPEKAIVDLLGAIALTRQRAELRTRIAHLEGTPPPAETTPSRPQLDAQLAAAKRMLAIDVEATEMDPESGTPGPPIDAIRRALAQQVLAKGFSLPPESDWGDAPSWLVARARISFERLDLGGRQGFAAIEWEAALEIEDPAAGGQIVGLLTGGTRATHINERTARRLAREEATTFLSEAFASWLDERYAPAP